MPLNVKLKLAILASGRMQKAIARKANIDASVLSGVVQGKRILSDKEKQRLSRELKSSVEELGL